MQKYQSIISGTNGSVIRNVPVTVLKEDGSLAEIFMDREGQVQAPNPLVTDSRGVFYFYAKNGRYSLRTAADGVQITDADTVLLFDPDETASDGPIADAVRRAEDAAERAETALSDSGLQSMVQDAQDAAANAVQAVIDANQAVASIDAALIEAGEAKEAAQAAAQTASNAASGAQAVKDSLLTYGGTLSATPEWSDVPAHEDTVLDAQAQAALNRVEKLKDDQQLLKQRADKAILSYPNYASASAAAATLPDGQVVEYADTVGTLTVAEVIGGSLVNARPADFGAMPESFGAGGKGLTDDTEAILKAAATGALHLRDGSVYRFSRLAFPANLRVSGYGVLRSDGTTGPGNDHQITVGANFKAVSLTLSTPGTEPNFYPIVFTGDDAEIGTLSVTSDVQRVGSEGVWFKGSRIHVGVFKSRNILRPLAFFNYDTVGDPASDIRVDAIDIETYTRGLVANNVSNAKFGPIFCRKRSTSASKSPGHNGILLQGVQNIEFGDIHIEEAGEHAVRIGGSVDGSAESQNIKFGIITGIRSGGCVFKISPTPPEVTKNVTVDGVFGIDVGEGTLGGNSECVRISNFHNVRIGFIHVAKDKHSNSCTSPLRFNNGSWLRVGEIFGESMGVAMQIAEDTDSGTGDMSNVFIGSLQGTVTGTDAIGITYSSGGRKIGNIFIDDVNLTGFTSRLLAFSAGLVTTGPISLSGKVYGGVHPAILNAPSGDNFVIDLKYNRYRASGSPGSGAPLNYAQVLVGRSIDVGITPNWFGDHCISGHSISPGAGVYGGAYTWTRNGSTRRGAAIAMKQITADDKENGLAFLVQDVSGASNESLQERMLLKHNGTLMLNNLAIFAGNAEAITGGLVAGDFYKTATGELRIVV